MSRTTVVYVVGETGKHFHRAPTCYRITTGQRGKNPAPLRELELDEIRPRQSPCRACYPDSPRVKVFTPYCHTCASPRPCEHNGGVLVRVPRVWRYGSALLEPGQITWTRRYVWPNRAHRYEPV